MQRGLIQIAGVHDPSEAKMLVRCGADLIGIPLRLTVNEEDLGDAEAAALSRQLPGRCCLITYLDTVDEIVDLVKLLAVQVVQLHGDVDPIILPRVRQALPDLFIIKSLIVGREDFADLLRAVDQFTPAVDAFITDTYDPLTGAEGATGIAHDWTLSRKLVLASARPVILAGGLNHQNVAVAIRQVQPWGVDVHTGVESVDGRKDPLLVSQFCKAAKAAFRQIYSK